MAIDVLINKLTMLLNIFLWQFDHHILRIGMFKPSNPKATV